MGAGFGADLRRDALLGLRPGDLAAALVARLGRPLDGLLSTLADFLATRLLRVLAGASVPDWRRARFVTSIFARLNSDCKYIYKYINRQLLLIAE